MKKLVSVLCALTLVLGIFAAASFGASAAEAAKTAVDVKEGDEVVYALHLEGVSKPIIGCDFSFYYDSDVFELVSVEDFSGNTDENEWLATINPDLDGEVRGNWSILKGVDFSSERNFVTLTLKAKAEGTGHISYFIRYMYDDNIFNSEDRPQITDYVFTCDVTLNGEPVLEDAQPELNVEETQTTGLFVNSVTGDSADADPELPGTVAKKPAAADSAASSKADSDSVVSTPQNDSGTGSKTAVDKTSDDKTAASTVPATTAEGYYITATDAAGNVTATSDQAPAVTTTGSNNKGGSSPVMWIIIVLIVLAGGGAAAYYFMKKKPEAADAQGASDSKTDDTKSE